MPDPVCLDDATIGGALARLKLVGELASIKAGLKNAQGADEAGALAAIGRLKQVARANQIRIALGAYAGPKVAVATTVTDSPDPAPKAAIAADNSLNPALVQAPAPAQGGGDSQMAQAPRNLGAPFYESVNAISTPPAEMKIALSSTATVPPAAD